MGQGQSDYVTGPWGWITSWLLNLFGVAIVATVTGALVGFVIDLLLKEGQGMGAAGFNDHVVVCGWNSTARELIEELKSDDYDVRVVVIEAPNATLPAMGSISSAATAPPRRISAGGHHHGAGGDICPATGPTTPTCIRSLPSSPSRRWHLRSEQSLK